MARRYNGGLGWFPLGTFCFHKVDPLFSPFLCFRATIAKKWYRVKANTFFRGGCIATASYTPSRHLQEVLSSWSSRFALIFSWKQALLFPKWCHESTRPILPYSSVVNLEEANFMNSEKSQKINENSYEENFFTLVISVKEIYLSEKKLGVSGTFTRCPLNMDNSR